MWEDFRNILNDPLLTVGKTHLRISSILMLLIFWIVFIFFLKLIRKSIYSIKNIDQAKKYSIFTLIQYILLVIAIVLSLEILGFNLSILLAGSAALLVGLGLGIQNLFSDYISGIVILIDNTIKIGDVIEINGIVGTVKEIHLRTSLLLTRDDKYIIIPNSDLTRHELINWTHNELASRFEVSVGVDYSANVDLVIQLLSEVADEEAIVLKHPKPFVRFTDFGESALQFSVFFWVEDVFHAEQVKSQMRLKILEKFRINNISIPYPQRVIHQSTDN